MLKAKELRRKTNVLVCWRAETRDAKFVAFMCLCVCIVFFYEMREKYEKERIKQFLLLCRVKHIAELFSFEQIKSNTWRNLRTAFPVWFSNLKRGARFLQSSEFAKLRQNQKFKLYKNGIKGLYVQSFIESPMLQNK